MTVAQLFGFLVLSLMLWAFGYIYPNQGDDYELRLPGFIKALYGRRSRPLYLRGVFMQTLGIALAAGYVIEFLAVRLNRPILPGITLFILCHFWIGIPVMIQMIIHSRKDKDPS